MRSHMTAGGWALWRAGASTAATSASAQEALKIGLILPMTGPFASTGRQIEAAAKLYMQQNGDTSPARRSS